MSNIIITDALKKFKVYTILLFLLALVVTFADLVAELFELKRNDLETCATGSPSGYTARPISSVR